VQQQPENGLQNGRRRTLKKTKTSYCIQMGCVATMWAEKPELEVGGHARDSRVVEGAH
jgi:hypothetical protein